MKEYPFLLQVELPGHGLIPDEDRPIFEDNFQDVMEYCMLIRLIKKRPDYFPASGSYIGKSP